MSAVKDRLVNVPVGASDVINTIKNIPRTPREAGLIQVKLKRKLEYKNHHKHEYIDPVKIFKVLDHLKKRDILIISFMIATRRTKPGVNKMC